MVSNIKCIVFVIKRDKTKPIKFDPIMKKKYDKRSLQYETRMV